jgi:hypothetical protein
MWGGLCTTRYTLCAFMLLACFMGNKDPGVYSVDSRITRSAHTIQDESDESPRSVVLRSDAVSQGQRVHFVSAFDLIWII